MAKEFAEDDYAGRSRSRLAKVIGPIGNLIAAVPVIVALVIIVQALAFDKLRAHLPLTIRAALIGVIAVIAGLAIYSLFFDPQRKRRGGADAIGAYYFGDGIGSCSDSHAGGHDGCGGGGH